MKTNAPYSGGAAIAPPANRETRFGHGAFTRPLPESAVPGWILERHASLDSTSIEARRRIAQGMLEKRVIVAETQTMGQCRHDRLWESRPGVGLWASFIRPAAVPLETLPQSTLVLAVAVREGILSATGLHLRAKWPNDLLSGGRKCCGLLVESVVQDSDEAMPLILGVGINCNHAADDFPEYLRGVATSLSLLANGKMFCRENLLQDVAFSIEKWFGIWEDQGFSPVRAAWLAGNCTIGNRIVLPEGYGHPCAMAHDLEGDGALVALADDGTALRIDSGEIRFTQDVAADRRVVDATLSPRNE